MKMKALFLKIGKLYRPKHDPNYPNRWITYSEFDGDTTASLDTEIRIEVTKNSVLMYLGTIPNADDRDPQLHVFLLEDRFVKLSAEGVDSNIVRELKSIDDC